MVKYRHLLHWRGSAQPSPGGQGAKRRYKRAKGFRGFRLYERLTPPSAYNTKENPYEKAPVYYFVDSDFSHRAVLAAVSTVSDYWNSLHQSRAIAEYAEQVANLDDDLYEGLWAVPNATMKPCWTRPTAMT